MTSYFLPILGQGRETTMGELKRILGTLDDKDLVLVEAGPYSNLRMNYAKHYIRCGRDYLIRVFRE